MRSKSKEKMEQIKAYVESYAMSNGGKTPTNREIAPAVGLTHSCISRYLRAMDELGMIRYRKGKLSTDLIDKIETMDEQKQFEYGHKAKERIENVYSWKIIGDKYKSAWTK